MRLTKRTPLVAVTGLALLSMLVAGFFAVHSNSLASSSSTGQAILSHATRGNAVTPSSLSAPAKQYSLTSAERAKLVQDQDWRQGLTNSGQVAAANNPNAPSTSGIPLGTSSGVSPVPHLQQNFDALYGSLNGTVNPVGDVEPPDQGLCVTPTSELELINDIGAVYDRGGNTELGGPFNLDAFFAEPVVFLAPKTNDLILTFPTDPRCYYDASSQTVFASMLTLAIDLNTGNFYSHTHLDLAVIPNGDLTQPYNVYYLDVTDDGSNHISDPGCPCLGDQPLLGVDSSAVYLSTNEFPIFANGFNGAHIYAIDKSQLLSGASSVNVALFDNLTIGGSIAASIQPATNISGTAGELFLNALDPNATTDNRIGVWAVTDEAALDKGKVPTLTQVLLTSEAYGQPPLATQKGAPGVTLNTDDDRMQQVTYQSGSLWSSLDTAINVSGDTATRSGAAWFQVTPQLTSAGLTGASIVSQGYDAVKGAYILYPAIVTNASGNSAMVGTLSGDDYYPTAVYTTSQSNANFRAWAVGGQGLNAEQGFTCLPAYGGPPCRWGDYSAATLDPNGMGSGLGIWMATEYVGNDPSDGFLNYSTRVMEA